DTPAPAPTAARGAAEAGGGSEARAQRRGGAGHAREKEGGGRGGGGSPRAPRLPPTSDHIHAAEHPETTHVRPGGFTLWFTGLSGSGKTTIAHLVGPELDRRGLVVEYLDGDNVRMHLSKGLGFSKEDRDTHVERGGWGACRSTRQGGAAITAAISP